MKNVLLDKLLLAATGALVNHNLTIATAESCTGGLISSLLTSLPGSSAWFTCGFVTYSNESKHKLLAIPRELITRYGAVSREVAMAMSEGALSFSDADITLAVTGIAGPTGGSIEKPVGTVWLALALRNSQPVAIPLFFPHSDRDAIRSLTCQAALEELISLISLSK